MNAFPLALIVLLLAFVSQGAQAHTDHDKARFVAEDGVDAGKCDNRFRPCKTLSYAARQANKGDKILVAEGQYYFDNAQHAQVLNDSLLPVLGGFSREDHYQAQKPALHKTTLVFEVSTSDTVTVTVNESVVSLPTDTNSNSSGGGGSTTLFSMLGLLLAFGWRRVKMPDKAHKLQLSEQK